MTPLWDYFWPIFAAGIIIGAVTGHLTYRRRNAARRDRPEGTSEPVRDRRRRRAFAGGAAAALVAAALWSGPLGGGDRLTRKVESSARTALDRLEMTQVRARLERRPLRRRLVLSGPADDFQRAQLVQILDDIPGVAGVRWSSAPQAPGGAN